jgi:hypothetical protein
MKRKCALLFIPSTALATLGCDSEYEVCVNVERCDSHTPLVGVHVIFRYGIGGATIGREGYTDPAGHYCTSAMGDTSPPDRYYVAFDKPGYGAVEYTTGRRESSTFCLLPQICAPGSSATCTCGESVGSASGSGLRA